LKERLGLSFEIFPPADHILFVIVPLLNASFFIESFFPPKPFSPPSFEWPYTAFTFFPIPWQAPYFFSGPDDPISPERPPAV